ncbi:MAG TPA: serine hydrolase domain-containing protein [Steroidobacter sp.]
MRPVPLFLASTAATLWVALAHAQKSEPAQGEGVPPVPPAPTELAPETTAANVAVAELTKADVDAWLDGFMPYALHQGDIAGAVVVVVKDGEVLTQRGFGYADVKARKPVDPEHTLFRPGSVSKLFTWTAVMQLVEQGKVDLDTDVNEYLDFEIPHYDGKPVTLRNILTHTPGFEEQVKGLMGTPDGGAPDLGEHLKRWVPGIIFEPGTTPAYSNYATALAGYIVERVSGMPFDDYLDQHIFQPLGMEHSTFRQPLPERLQPLMSKGYPAASLPEKPFEIVGPAPAGSLSAPGADMARFMIAHLQKGRYGDVQILKPETAELMHTSATTFLPRVDRMLLGFYETNYNGRRVISHGGDTQWFHSYLHLFIDDNVGLFVSVNSSGKDGASGRLRDELFHQFADRYLPGPTLEGEVDEKTAAEHARMIAGSYINSRRMETTFLSLLNLLGTVKVTDNGDGTIGLSMVTSPSGVPLKWREVEPFVWRQVDGETLLSAVVEEGRVKRFSFSGVSPFMVFEPMPAAKSSTWLLPAFIAALVALTLTMLAWPISALTRRHYGVQYALAGEDAKVHRWIRIAATATVVVWLGWILLISTMMSNFVLLSERTDIWLRILQVLGLVVFFGGAAVGVWNAWSVLRSRRSWYAKLWAVLLALGLLVSLWVALAFHIISFSVKY